jgi:hypothetical protein
MSSEHDVKRSAVEVDPVKIRKLDEFREEVKRALEGSRVHRVYKEFDSLQDFEVGATRSVAVLRRLLDEQSKPVHDDSPIAADRDSSDGDGVPVPPERYEPPGLGSRRSPISRKCFATASLESQEPTPVTCWPTPAAP